MLKLNGFPSEISDYIELPNIAELLTYPTFFDTDIDSAYKYASDFQKKLIDKTPIRGNKNTISVLSEVRLLAPKLRSMTMGGHPSDNDFRKEWHIDCEENEDGSHIYHEERDIVHILSNNVSCLTEFNKNEMLLDFDYQNKSYMDFINYLNTSDLNLEVEKMPSNRIVTFTNHLHRAVNPEKLEFRYIFRIVETNRKRPASEYNPYQEHSTSIVLPGGKNEENIVKEKNKITIFIPSIVKEDPKFKTLLKDNLDSNEIKNEERVFSSSFDEKVQKYQNFNCDDKFNQININSVYASGLGKVIVESMPLYNLSEDSIRFFANNFDSLFVLKEKNNTDNTFTLTPITEIVDNKIVFSINIPESEKQYIKPSETYIVECFPKKNSLYSVYMQNVNNFILFN